MEEKAIQDINGVLGRCKEFYESDLEPKILTRHQLYRGDKAYYAQKYPRLSEKCELVIRELWGLTEWYRTQLSQTFFGGESDRIVTIRGVGPEDTPRAELLRRIINWQLRKGNTGWRLFRAWWKDALVYNLGVVKCVWKRRVQVKEITEVMSADRASGLSSGGATVLETQALEAPDLVQVKYGVPLFEQDELSLERVPPWCIMYTPTAKTLDDAPFVAQRIVMTAEDLRRKGDEGTYDKTAVEAAIAAGGAGNPSRVEQAVNPALEKYGNTVDIPGLAPVDVYECWTKVEQPDGRLKDMVVTIAGGQVLREEENPWGRHPFFAWCPIEDDDQVWPDLGIPEIVGEIQDQLTYFHRQIAVNIALNNDARTFVDDSRVNLDDLLADRLYVRVNGNPQQIMQPLPVQPIAAWTLPYLEELTKHEEELTGRNRYNQGQEAPTLNHTATGVNLLFQASMARLGDIQTGFLEGPMKALLRHMVHLNQLYLRPETVLRITGGQLEIPPDDLSGEYDIDLTGVAGLAERDKRIQNLQLFLGNLFPMGAQMGLLGPQQWSLAARRLLAESGVNDAANFIPEVGMNGGLPGGPSQGTPGGPMQGVPPALAGQLPTLSPGVAGEGGSLGGRGHVAP